MLLAIFTCFIISTIFYYVMYKARKAASIIKNLEYSFNKKKIRACYFFWVFFYTFETFSNCGEALLCSNAQFLEMLSPAAFRRANTTGILSRLDSSGCALHRLPVRAPFSLVHSYELTGPRKLYAMSSAAARPSQLSAIVPPRESLWFVIARAQWIRVMPEDVDRIKPLVELREWSNARARDSLSTARQIDINRGITPAALPSRSSRRLGTFSRPGRKLKFVTWRNCAKFSNLWDAHKKISNFF